MQTKSPITFVTRFDIVMLDTGSIHSLHKGSTVSVRVCFVCVLVCLCVLILCVCFVLCFLLLLFCCCCCCCCYCCLLHIYNNYKHRPIIITHRISLKRFVLSNLCIPYVQIIVVVVVVYGIQLMFVII